MCEEESRGCVELARLGLADVTQVYKLKPFRVFKVHVMMGTTRGADYGVLLAEGGSAISECT